MEVLFATNVARSWKVRIARSSLTRKPVCVEDEYPVDAPPNTLPKTY